MLPTPEFWHETRRDLNAATERLEAGQPLTITEWCAWIWHRTSIPTAELAVEGGRKIYLCTTISGESGIPNSANYLRVSEICRRNGRWVAKLGTENLRDALGWLADNRERQNGWNALCGATTGGDAPNCPELTTARQALSQVKALAAQKSLVIVEGGRSEPIPTIPAALRPGVEAELAGVSAHMGKFFSEEG